MSSTSRSLSRPWTSADEINDALANVGYPRMEHITADLSHTSDSALWRKRIHCAADPGRPSNIHVRVDGWPGQQFALLFRDWLTANSGVREDYLAAKRRALSAADYAEAKEPWFADAYQRAWAWAKSTGMAALGPGHQAAAGGGASAGGAAGAAVVGI